MNPRTFCREPSYESAIALTYSFNPLFFERIVLPDLWAGGTGEVIVIADGQQIESALPRAIGQVRHLGRSYQLCPATSRGAQHAKLLLRLGANGALVWVGSGNLTFGGWGGNRELATAWRVAPEDSAGASTTRALLESIVRLVDGGSQEVLARALDLAWIRSSPGRAASDRAVLMSGPDGTLADQLARRWNERRFNRMRVLTGSTDREGAFLAWAAHAFGVTEVLVGLDPTCSSFDPVKLEALPLDIRVVPIVPLPDNPRPLHAKLVWFEGVDGCGAVVGSANCSSAAWLIPPEVGGNVELVVVFDQCSEDEFADSLKPLDGSAADRPTAVLGLAPRDTPAEKPNHASDVVRLVELTVSEGLGHLVAVVEPPLDSAESVEADFSGLRTRLDRADREGRRWVGPMPDLPPGVATRFGHLVIRYPDGFACSTTRWLDEQDELRHALRGRRIASVITSLAQPAKSSEQRKLLEDLAWITAAILSDSDGFPDPSSAHEPRPPKHTRDAPPVDPHDLVRRLADLKESDPLRPRTGPTPGLPLLGVMRVLFPEEPKTDEAENESEPLTEQPEGGRSSETPSLRPEPPPDALRKRLVDHMTLFLRKLSDPDFVKRCTATQLVQAAAFPLAVAAKGLEGSWIDQEAAALWVIRVSDLLFRAELNPAAPQAGLLTALRDRYESEGREETFRKVIGDGTLCVALSAALSQVDWRGTSRGLDRALALREVFGEPLLTSAIDDGRLAYLLCRLRTDNTRHALLGQAADGARTIWKIEKLLEEEFPRLQSSQIGHRNIAGDPLWNPRAGFARAEEDGPIANQANLHVHLRKRGKVVLVKPTFYVNLRLAANTSPQIADALSVLAPCWPDHS